VSVARRKARAVPDDGHEAPLERMTDTQRTCVILDLLSSYHTREGNGTPCTEKLMAARKVFLTEVADGTGFAPGYADALAVSLWPSDGYRADGYEVKASRADLKRELDRPSKWSRVGIYCTRWWLAVWDAKWLDDLRIPEAWGLLAYDGAGGLRQVRQAGALVPTPWTLGFTAAVIRRAAEAAPGAAMLERAREIGYSRGRQAGRIEMITATETALTPLLAEYRGSDTLRAYHRTVPLAWAVQSLLTRLDAERTHPPEPSDE